VTRWKLLAVVAFAMLAHQHVAAQSLGNPTPPAASITQHLDAQLPLDLPLTDETGQAQPLRGYFSTGKPVLLMLGYHRCPQLCGLLMHGVLEALQAGGIDRRNVRLLSVSIDPEDTPATALARRDADLAYADFLAATRKPEAPLDLHLLVGTQAATSRLAREVGFIYQRVPSDGDRAEAAPQQPYAHAAAVIVVTPQGRVSRYLMGVRFDHADLRQALAEASRSGIGTLSDRIALLCAHVDLKLGRHGEAVMNATRATGLIIIAALGGWGWRRERARKEPR